MFKSKAHKAKMEKLLAEGKIPQATYDDWVAKSVGKLSTLVERAPAPAPKRKNTAVVRAKRASKA